MEGASSVRSVPESDSHGSDADADTADADDSGMLVAFGIVLALFASIGINIGNNLQALGLKKLNQLEEQQSGPPGKVGSHEKARRFSGEGVRGSGLTYVEQAPQDPQTTRTMESTTRTMESPSTDRPVNSSEESSMAHVSVDSATDPTEDAIGLALQRRATARRANLIWVVGTCTFFCSSLVMFGAFALVRGALCA